MLREIELHPLAIFQAAGVLAELFLNKVMREIVVLW